MDLSAEALQGDALAGRERARGRQVEAIDARVQAPGPRLSRLGADDLEGGLSFPV